MWGLFVALLFTLAGPFMAGPAAAAEGCGGAGTLTGLVTVDAPAPNAVVSGTFDVRGVASAGLPVGEISRVEVTLGGKVFFDTYAPANTVAFSVTVDTTNIAPGQKTMTVLACGTTFPAISRGEKDVPVKVEAAPIVTSTSAPHSTTTVDTPALSVPGGGSATTVAPANGQRATAGGAAGAAGPTTTASSGPTTTAAPSDAKAAAPARPEPVRPRSGPDSPLVLTETPSKPGNGPPLWVGAVVGLSGGLGLLFSAASWRRRTRPPLRAEPVDPDLVDVR